MSPRRKLKLRLWEEDPHCHWCGIITNPNPLKHNAVTATVDHIYSNYDLRRRVSSRVVLACSKCNNFRSEQETNQLSADEKHARSLGVRRFTHRVTHRKSMPHNEFLQMIYSNILTVDFSPKPVIV